MSNLVIVAIPEEMDPVWKVSSEKVPHLTICYLGDPENVPNQNKIAEFLEHAAQTTLTRFYLDVDKRDTLGDDDADVIFFEGWDLPELVRFRSFLLMDNNISKAYHSVDQHPEWLPHLTLGYPKTPAKKMPDGYERLYSVMFDKVALWSGDYEGPEFDLKKHNYDLEVSMGDTVAVGAGAVAKALTHHGVKGMKWGVRNKTPQVTVSEKGKKLKSKGGHDRPAHDDAVAAETARRIAKSSGTKALSNDELQALATRMNLEQQVSRLQSTQAKNPVKKFVGKLLAENAKRSAEKVAAEATAKQVAKMLEKKK